MLTLYQFPISHYCEKVRWALDYKHIDHDIRNLLPGIHVLKTKKIAPRTSVPILVHDDRVIQGSGSIISYLDENFPAPRLTPKTPELKEEALEWEQYVDSEIGIHVRLCCYHILLEHPDAVIPFFTHNGPWYGKLILPFMFPKLKLRMRKLMNINAESAQRSRELLGTAIDRLYDRLRNNPFLVGNQFTRADLATASLLAPLYRPKKYGLHWPEQLPPQLDELADEFHDRTKWVHRLYEQFR